MVSHSLKGMYNKHLPMPIYIETRDINQVLEFYKIQAENKDSCLKYLMQNLCVLPMFLSAEGQKCCLLFKLVEFITSLIKLSYYLVRQHTIKISQRYLVEQIIFPKVY